MGTMAILEDMGHACLEATSGATALSILKEDSNIDILITDHAMPNMTGMELIEVARQVRPNLPVILASGYVDIVGLSDLSVPRLSKPITDEQLEKLLNDLMT